VQYFFIGVLMLYLIDSAFLINGANFTEKDLFITVPLVMDEFKDFNSKTISENALKEGKLSLIEPKQFFLKKVEIDSNSIRLSNTDKQLAALALQLKKEKKLFIAVTDDFSLQNFFSLNKINFVSVMQGEIQKTAKFEFKCSQCGKVFSLKKSVCDICGGKIIFKMKFI
jgi:rRNA maturation endonuclease Nob1